jgi:serine/threonine-protein kinase
MPTQPPRDGAADPSGNTPSDAGAPHVMDTTPPASSAGGRGTGSHVPAADRDWLPGSAGRLHLGEEIAHGGMGAVLHAHDPVMKRDLAVKVLRPEHQENADLVRRFVEEAQIGGQLQHPGIVPVHELGTLPDGRPFIAMKLIKGRTLAERPDPAHDLPRFLGVFGQVCQAVAYAHSKGVLHRDLKPQNVMVGAFGEVQVMDWGLAKVLGKEPAAGAPPPASVIHTVRSDQSAQQSQPGAVLGTYAYMAPEQARGEAVDEGRTCSVWAPCCARS